MPCCICKLQAMQQPSSPLRPQFPCHEQSPYRETCHSNCSGGNCIKSHLEIHIALWSTLGKDARRNDNQPAFLCRKGQKYKGWMHRKRMLFTALEAVQGCFMLQHCLHCASSLAITAWSTSVHLNGYKAEWKKAPKCNTEIPKRDEGTGWDCTFVF